MAWNDVQTDSDTITSTEWNDMVSYITYGFQSGASNWNSLNYTNSSLTWDTSLGRWKAMKSGGLNLSTTDARYPGSSTAVSKYKHSSGIWKFASSQAFSGGTIITSDIYIYGDTISGLRDPTFPSAAANKHYIDTISGNLADNPAYISTQGISGQWRVPIYRTNKPAAAASWDGRIIMSSGSTNNKARIWICAKNDDGSTYDWIQIAVGN